MIDEYDEKQRILSEIDRKRLEIGDCLFSTSRYAYRVSNARKMVQLSTELAELAAIMERET